MYESHFGLSVKPFSLSPDPRFLYFGERHSQAYAMLQYGIMEQVGFAVITGEVGSGKTTLLRKLLDEIDDRDNVALISHTHRGLRSVIPTVLDGFGVLECMREPLPEELLYRTFVDHLVEQYAKGRRSILIIDEAQNLSIEALEQLRLLSNVNADGHLLLQTLLIGQPELNDKLRLPELSQFAQRISVDFRLTSLSVRESVEYIDHRIKVAGGKPKIMDSAAKVLIAKASGGTPRLINNIADMSLVYAFGAQSDRVSETVVKSVLEDKQDSGVLPLLDVTLPKKVPVSTKRIAKAV